MKKQKRSLAAVLAGLVLAAVLFSLLFLAAEAGHDCIGEDCHICGQMDVCMRLLQAVGVMLFISSAEKTAVWAAAVLQRRSVPAFSATLVTLNIKLSN